MTLVGIFRLQKIQFDFSKKDIYHLIRELQHRIYRVVVINNAPE